MTFLSLLSLSAATAYFSYTLVYTDGIGNLFGWLREHDPIGVTRCIYCLAIWVALAFVLVYSIQHTMMWDDVILYTAAVAGLALMMIGYSGMKHL